MRIILAVNFTLAIIPTEIYIGKNKGDFLPIRIVKKDGVKGTKI